MDDRTRTEIEGAENEPLIGIESDPKPDFSNPPAEEISAHELNHDFTSIDRKLDMLETRLNSLQDFFEQRFRYDTAKDRAFDTLYQKMHEFDGTFQASLKKNLVMSLLLLYDSIQKIERHSLVEMSDVARTISLLREQLLAILYAEEVEPMGELGISFDHTRQKVVRVQPCSDITKDKIVERVVREGFFSGSKVLRPQEVVMYKYESTLTDHQTENKGE